MAARFQIKIKRKRQELSSILPLAAMNRCGCGSPPKLSPPPSPLKLSLPMTKRHVTGRQFNNTQLNNERRKHSSKRSSKRSRPINLITRSY
jgi:hypothetical protein